MGDFPDITISGREFKKQPGRVSRHGWRCGRDDQQLDAFGEGYYRKLTLDTPHYKELKPFIKRKASRMWEMEKEFIMI